METWDDGRWKKINKKERKKERERKIVKENEIKEN